ncbi:MAG: hypothetical protein COS89_10000 [Deltaproteobacteria bacterium CG07_land_8_20_14_0_80_38_7]|nr:MAG: hypothetical protein COS89_10000 [Deltaproteobacteria bacterium CG07_land_8_20_14_0_80_38_7]
MKILITGSTGYLGSTVVSILKQDSSIKIFGIDIKSPERESSYELFIRGSVTDPKVMAKLFEEAKPDVAIHLAFVVNALHDESKEDEIAIRGSLNFLECCKEHKVKKIIFMSSAAACGAHPDSQQPYTESSPVKGNKAYSYSRLKAETDRIAQKFMHDCPDSNFVILRPCLFVGPNTDNCFFEMLKFPLLPMIFEDGKTKDPDFQFIHELDMAKCIVAAIEKDVRGIFNIAGNGTLKYSDMALIAGKRRIALPFWLLYPATTLLWKLHLIGSPPGQLDFIRYPWLMDNSKMKRELFIPEKTTEEAFREFIDSR